MPGRAVAALRRAELGEGVLQRVGQRAVGQAFDGHDGRRRLVLDGQRQAGQDRLAVDQHGAGAALAELAAVLGAGQVEIFAQHLEQRLVDRNVQARALRR